jgi:hypothetical protein
MKKTFQQGWSDGAIALAALAVIASERARPGSASPLRAKLSRVAVLAAGLAPGVVALGALVAAGRAELGYVLKYTALEAYRSLPFPIPSPAGTPLPAAARALVWAGLPFLVLSVSSVILLAQLRRRASLSSTDARRLGLQLGLTLLLAGLMPFALFRADLVHFYPALVVSGCIGAGLLRRAVRLAPVRLRGGRDGLRRARSRPVTCGTPGRRAAHPIASSRALLRCAASS